MKHFIFIIILIGNVVAPNLLQSKIKYPSDNDLNKVINETLVAIILNSNREDLNDTSYIKAKVNKIWQSDIDNDGDNDVIVECTFLVTGGNSGWDAILVLSNKNGFYTYLFSIGASNCCGDIDIVYISIEKIENNLIYFKGKKYKNTDPQCCPSIERRIIMKIVGDKLVKVPN